MQEQNKKMKLLDSAPVPKALLALGLPTMIGMLINALYNLADSYFVGGLGTAQLGALTVAYPLGQIIVGLGLLYGNGAASCLSRQLGQGDMENAEKTASTALYSSICTGAAVIACCLIFLKPLLEMLGASTTVMPYAVTYTSIYIVFSLFNVFNVTMNNIVSSEGAAKTTMCVLMAGAAIATGISQFVSTLIYIIYIVRKKSVFTFNVKNFCPSKTIMSEILKIGIPTLVFQLLTSLSMSLVNDGAKAYGDSALAAMGPVTKMMSVGSLMVFGFLKGLQPIAGYSYGAKKYERLHKTIKLSIIWSTIFCAVFGLTVAVFSSSIISGFTQNDTEMIRVGQTALRANGLSFVLFGFYTVYSSLFLALGKAREGCFLGACRQGICFVPLILILPALCGLKGILYAQPAADVISAVITVFMALHLHRKLNAEIMK